MVFTAASTILLITKHCPNVNQDSKRGENNQLRSNAFHSATSHKDRAHGVNKIAKRIDEREMLRPIGHARNGSEESAEQHQAH